MLNHSKISIESMRKFFQSGGSQSLAFRHQSLDRLEQMIRENQDAICKALFADLSKPYHEALISEIAVTLKEIAMVKKNLCAWMKPKRQRTPLALWPAKSRIYFEPLGVVLIIAPWNYPFQLALAPLIGALAAGNCAVVKPSEITTNTSHLIANLIARYFPSEQVKVVEGGVDETTELLKIKFDHIFFTGSASVAKIIMQAAAVHLTPITLELGGKSPVIVCEDADLDLAARRVVWGKCYNAGQTCVAPDYVYVHESVVEVFLEKIKDKVIEQFGSDPQKSQSYARIVNEHNFSRVTKLIDANKIHSGGRTDSKDFYVEPTVLRDVSWADSVMQEEIFGPVLPVMTYTELDQVFATINSRPKPLSAYLFTSSRKHKKDFIQKISFGGGCINDVVVHLSNPFLPFGGVGDSGMGNYHGENSFRVFSHCKSVMHRNGFLDLSARYAPYTDGKIKFLRRLFGV